MSTSQKPSNPRHSSASALWQTPQWLADASRQVLQGIDLDPASTARANKTIGAARFYNRQDNGLNQSWGKVGQRVSIFLNPPGGWHNGKYGDSELRRWWAKTVFERKEDTFGHMLWLAFSIEALQVTQVNFEVSLLDFPTCILASRVSFIDPASGKIVSGNTHSSSMTYIPGRFDRTNDFYRVFRGFGKVMLPANISGVQAFQRARESEAK